MAEDCWIHWDSNMSKLIRCVSYEQNQNRQNHEMRSPMEVLNLRFLRSKRTLTFFWLKTLLRGNKKPQKGFKWGKTLPQVVSLQYWPKECWRDWRESVRQRKELGNRLVGYPLLPECSQKLTVLSTLELAIPPASGSHLYLGLQLWLCRTSFLLPDLTRLRIITTGLREYVTSPLKVEKLPNGTANDTPIKPKDKVWMLEIL